MRLPLELTAVGRPESARRTNELQSFLDFPNQKSIEENRPRYHIDENNEAERGEIGQKGFKSFHPHEKLLFTLTVTTSYRPKPE